MPIVTCIEDLRTLARRRVPKAIFDYVEGGSYAELTLHANRSAFDAVRLRQRVMTDVSGRSQCSVLAGEAAQLPVAIAPTGLTGLVWARGEILAAQAAEDFGVPFTLSTMSICSIEDIAAATRKPFWFQLYMMRDRDFVASLIERAKAAGCSALVLTVDLQIQGQRHRDIRNGLAVPPRLTLANAIDLATKPAWVARILAGRRTTFGNLAGFIPKRDKLSTLSQWVMAQFEPCLSWDDVRWVRGLWPGKLIVKGVLDADDAREAVAAGADAVVVSNHGGRQLDGAPATLHALPAIAQAIGQDCEVWLDGGIRCGQDVLKALALGAQGTMIGRAFLYGLGALGGTGVTTALTLLQRELDVTMALVGARQTRDIGPQVLFSPEV